MRAVCDAVDEREKTWEELNSLGEYRETDPMPVAALLERDDDFFPNQLVVFEQHFTAEGKEAGLLLDRMISLIDDDAILEYITEKAKESGCKWDFIEVTETIMGRYYQPTALGALGEMQANSKDQTARKTGGAWFFPSEPDQRWREESPALTTLV